LTTALGREAGGVFTLGEVIPSSYSLKDRAATRIDMAAIFSEVFEGARYALRRGLRSPVLFVRFDVGQMVY
jgi:hypothetical protein